MLTTHDTHTQDKIQRLTTLQDNSSELEALQKQAEDIITQARNEASARIQAAKKASEEDIAKAAEEHKKVDAYPGPLTSIRPDKRDWQAEVGGF
jgi:septal ring factor EnvC (AmiA/AmiB activator)